MFILRLSGQPTLLKQREMLNLLDTLGNYAYLLTEKQEKEIQEIDEFCLFLDKEKRDWASKLQREMSDWYSTEEYKKLYNLFLDGKKKELEELRQQSIKCFFEGKDNSEILKEAVRIKKLFVTDKEQAKQVRIETLLKVKNGFTLCPFHIEKTPSLKVYKDNTFHCFGCGKHGDVIDIYMGIYNTTFTEACQSLQNQ